MWKLTQKILDPMRMETKSKHYNTAQEIRNYLIREFNMATCDLRDLMLKGYVTIEINNVRSEFEIEHEVGS